MSRLRQKSEISSARPRFPVQDPQNFVRRPFVEQSAALTLTQLAQREGELGLSSDSIAVLVQSLIVSLVVFHGGWLRAQ